MNSVLLILIPFVAAIAALLTRSESARPLLLPATGLLHLALSIYLMIYPPTVSDSSWLGFDGLAAAMLPAVSVLFVICAFYAVPYLRQRHERPNRIFVASLLTVLGLLSAGHQARHLGVLWVATEAVTLASVPLLHFNKSARAYEATWKYLLVGGTGVALSLLGSFCLGYASLHGGGQADVTFSALIAEGAQLSKPWLIAAWVLLLVGYGTKMGLAPMHTWKPDAYGEAPGIVGAILAGGVTSVAFNALLRVRAVVDAGGESRMASGTLLAIGLFSIGLAALFLIGTRNFKRMLAYSSVEHMGILCVGAALGTAGTWAALFHLWSNAITKAALFMASGNLHRMAGSASLDEVRGMRCLAPKTSSMFVAGMFAITACPPFAPFFSELRILLAACEQGHWGTAGLFLTGLFFAFVGMSRAVFRTVDGRPRPCTIKQSKRMEESFGTLAPGFALLAISIYLGLFTPSLLRDTWSNAVVTLFVKP